MEIKIYSALFTHTENFIKLDYIRINIRKLLMHSKSLSTEWAKNLDTPNLQKMQRKQIMVHVT